MVLHIDGSHVKGKGSNGPAHVLGWGIVALFNDQHVEVQSATFINARLNGYHEMIAFVEAAIFANARGYAPHEVTVYTDDETVGYAGSVLHPGNYQITKAEQLHLRLRELTDALYCDKTFSLVMDYLRESRLHKIRGHNCLVYQERADYLARTGAWNLVKQEKEQESSLSFMEWLNQGIAYYTKSSEPPKVWVAPFVKQHEHVFDLVLL